MRNNTVNDFSHFYQMMDVLIIDDVQFFSGKEKTQDVFFHIFNHLHQTGKQIVLTSDKPPVEMQGMEQRLLSRFKWGLSADLQVPSLETRMAILEKKMYADGIELPREVIEYLAYSITTNVRELEGALISLVAQASLNRKAITLDLAKHMIDKFVKNTAREVSIDYIQKVVVCDYFDLPIELLKSKTRKREIVQARQISMYFAKKMTKSSIFRQHRIALRRQGPRDRAARLPDGEQPQRNRQALPQVHWKTRQPTFERPFLNFIQPRRIKDRTLLGEVNLQRRERGTSPGMPDAPKAVVDVVQNWP